MVGYVNRKGETESSMLYSTLYSGEEVARIPKNPTRKTFRKGTLEWRERYSSGIRLFYQIVTKANTCNRFLFGKHG
jgi:hypothetical protein